MRQNRRIRGVRAHGDCVVILPHPTFLWASESSSSFLLCTFTSARTHDDHHRRIQQYGIPAPLSQLLARLLARTCVYSHHFCVHGAVVHACHYVPHFVSLPISPGQKMVTTSFGNQMHSEGVQEKLDFFVFLPMFPMCSHQVPNGFHKFPSYTMSRARQSVQVNSQKVWAQKKAFDKWAQALSDILQIKLLKIYPKFQNLGPLMKMLSLLFLLPKKMEACTLQPDFFKNSFINVIIVIFNH